MLAVPFKANAARRHRIPRQRHRVTDWAEYDAALRQRGSLTVWFTDEAVAARPAQARPTPGGAALVRGPGDPDRPDAAGGVPPRLAPARGADRLRPPPARARPGRARPHHPVPPGRDAGGAATPTDRRAAAPAGGQHRPAADRARRGAGRGARPEDAPGPGEAAPGGGRRNPPGRGPG